MNRYPKQVFLLAGLSESGKSYAGMFFDERGVKRLKYARLFAHNELNQDPKINPYQILEQTSMPEDDQIRLAIASLKEICEAEGIFFCSIESMVKPSTTIKLREAMGPNVVRVIYFDVDEETRLQRQMGRENVDYETAQKIMLPRDRKKIQFGTPEIKNIADVIINNNGTKEELNQRLVELIKEYCR